MGSPSGRWVQASGLRVLAGRVGARGAPFLEVLDDAQN